MASSGQGLWSAHVPQSQDETFPNMARMAVAVELVLQRDIISFDRLRFLNELDTLIRRAILEKHANSATAGRLNLGYNHAVE